MQLQAWHYHGETPVAWGGYTWGKQLFPTPSKFLSAVAAAGLNVTLNLHLEPVDPRNEDPRHFEGFVNALGIAPVKPNVSVPSADSPPFTGTVAEEITKSRKFAEAYLALLDRMGTNFWYTSPDSLHLRPLAMSRDYRGLSACVQVAGRHARLGSSSAVRALLDENGPRAGLRPMGGPG